MEKFLIHGIYRYACPNCDGEIGDDRLVYKAPCPKCLRENKFRKIVREIKNKDYYSIVETYYNHLEEHAKRNGKLAKLYNMLKTVKEFEEFFAKATGGYKPWSAQRTWAIRLLKAKSFSIVAPTGMGKTMFALIASLYLVSKDRSTKIYLVFPTTPLLLQAYNKLVTLARRAGLNVCSDEEIGSKSCVSIIAIHGKLSKVKREEYTKHVEEGNFNILLTTNMYMHKHYDKLLGKKFKLIVMDDVDAILRSGKAIQILFKILGLRDEEIKYALEYVREQPRLLSTLARASSEEEKEAIRKKLEEYRTRLEEIKSKIETIVIVSSATGRPRGIYPKLFRVLLGFEVGSRAEAIRNIVDTYIEPINGIENTVLSLVKKLGDGGLVFVPLDKGVEYAEKIANILKDRGIKAEAFYAGKPVDLLDKYAKGELDVLIGVATYYGVIVRGLDLPDRIKYAIFTGVPRHKFSSKLEAPRPFDIIRILSILRDAVEGDEKRELELLLGRLSLRLRRLSQGALTKLREDLEKKLKGEPVEESPLLDLLIQALEKARSLLSRKDIWEKLRERGDIALVRENGKDYILIPDVATYVQASGRTSRLYPGGITKGLSIVIADDKRLLNGLIKRMKWLFEDFTMKPLSEIELEKLVEEITEERKRVKKILSGEITVEKAIELTKSALLIVESPNKAKTIASFFGKPSIRVLDKGLLAYDVTSGDYVITIIASIGHVYDLAVDTGVYNYGVKYNNGLFIPVYTDIKKCNDCGHQFTQEPVEGILRCPRCGSTNVSRKIDIIRMLQDLASEVDVVLIGTDPDTEGEKIGWDLKVLLEPYAKSIRRVEFHEVTRRAILNAIRNPREFNMKLVEAQIVRRVEDRWLGFALSSIAQKYFWTKYCFEELHSNLAKLHKNNVVFISGVKSIDEYLEKLSEIPHCCEENRNLSAGRVQTPVLGYIIKRFEEQKDPNNWKYYIIVGVNGAKLQVEVNRAIYERIKEELDSGREYLVEVEVIGESEEVVNPPPPFTTDMLLEEASIRLGLSTTRTMEIAQDLFELGLITYHRTDSTRVSDTGIAIAKAYLEEKYGEKYQEYFKPRTWGVGGAHEAIRPTRPIDPDRLRELVREGVLVLAKPLTRQHYEVYRLIFERFIASQMAPARVLKQSIIVKVNGFEQKLDRIVDILYKGFTEVYTGYIVVEPRVVSGKYRVIDIRTIRPPLARFHDVIKWMKTQEIGRPSTYAKIIQTIINRRYVEVVGKQKALMPTERGKLIYSELTKYYSDVVSVDVTRKLEKEMKEIEEGKRDYQEVLHNIFNELREKVIENLEVNNVLESMWKEYCGA
ncbi:MAG: reverse gyrase [Thermoprotei archaeon]